MRCWKGPIRCPPVSPLLDFLLSSPATRLGVDEPHSSSLSFTHFLGPSRLSCCFAASTFFELFPVKKLRAEASRRGHHTPTGEAGNMKAFTTLITLFLAASTASGSPVPLPGMEGAIEQLRAAGHSEVHPPLPGAQPAHPPPSHSTIRLTPRSATSRPSSPSAIPAPHTKLRMQIM